jgi:hypothetical protein
MCHAVVTGNPPNMGDCITWVIILWNQVTRKTPHKESSTLHQKYRIGRGINRKRKNEIWKSQCRGWMNFGLLLIYIYLPNITDSTSVQKLVVVLTLIAAICGPIA